MRNYYVESEKIWCSPCRETNFPSLSLGQVILDKLKGSDPKRVLEVEHESGASLTAAEIRSQTITVAQNLIRLGVNKGDTVIVFSKSNIKITPITFALYTIGAPVNFFYLDLKGDDIRYYFEKLDPTVILYEEEFKNDVFLTLENVKLHKLKHILSLDSKMRPVDEILFRHTGDIEAFQPPNIGDPNKLPAVLPFTSGSTGMPKIVMQSHAMMLQSVFNKWWHIGSNSVVCVLSDLRWMDQVGLMLQQVFFDVKRIYTSKCEKDFDDVYEFELLHKNKVTHFFTIPILILSTLRNAVQSNTISKLSHLKTILIGGEPVTDSLVKYLTHIKPNCKIIISYGMTELDVKIASDEEVADGKIVNGGILANGYIAKIVDEQGNSLGPNEKGRLCLKSKVPALGYFKNDEANREHFRGNGWFTTEEYAYMSADHLLNVVIRFKCLLRFNGKLVDPTSVENIINNHPNVQISALVGYSDSDSSAFDIGALFVVIGSVVNSDNMESEIIALLKHRLTNEQAELIRFLKIIDKMPLLNYCKINRTALSEMAAKHSNSYTRL